MWIMPLFLCFVLSLVALIQTIHKGEELKDIIGVQLTLWIIFALGFLCGYWSK
jgi:uncharacterized membrane protein